jgi:Na+-transporting methylmalonyl-CoA/oxaloacetate decarboxylase gamma subunit
MERVKWLGGVDMDTWTFGLTMLVVGMGGTLVVLSLMSLIMVLLKKAFPYKEEKEKQKG